MLRVLGAFFWTFLFVQCGAENEGAVSTRLASTDWVEVFVCTVDGTVHSLNALTGEILWSYQTEAIRHNEQLSFMALGQNFTFYPDRRKGDIYTSRDGQPYVPFPTAKKLVEMSPFQWNEGRAIFLAKKSHKRYFVDPESGSDIMPSLQCEAEPPSTTTSTAANTNNNHQGSTTQPFGLSRWLEIIRTDYDIVAEQILDLENSFPLAPLGSSAPRELEVLKFSVSDYKLYLRTPQSASEEDVPSVLPRLTDVGGLEGGTIQASHPSSRLPMWQTKFVFPLTHFAHVLMKAGKQEYLSSVKVEDAAFEYLAIGDGSGKLVPVFEEGGSRLIPISSSEIEGDPASFPEVKLLPAPPTAFSDIQIAVIVGAVLGGILVLSFILFYIKCVRVDLSSSSSFSLTAAASPSALLTSTITSLSLPASPLPSANTSPESSPAIPNLALPLTPNLTSFVSSRYVREFEELGGLEGAEGKNLGKGGYGTVVRVRNITDDMIYAVKKVRKFGELSTLEIEQILREVKLLAKLEHPNIVRYFASWVEEEEVPRGVEKEEADGRSKTRTITLMPPRAKKKQSRATAAVTILETVTAAIPPSSSLFEPSSFVPSSVYPASSLEEIDDLLGFEFGSEETVENEDGIMNGGCSGTSLSSLSSQTSSASQASLLSELSQLSRNVSAESLQSETGNGENGESEEDSPSHSSSQRPQPFSALSLDTNTVILTGNQKQWTLYIQMQLCSSGTLEHWMSRPGRRVEPDLNLLIFKQIVSALCYVHDPPHGLIHRDLKPANIFMVDDRSARVGDFGLSKRTNRIQAGCVSAEESLSHTAGVGSPLYCSPEQLAGREYTNKTDIFSLGVIFVEMHHVFSTKMERNMCLQDYRRYHLPKSEDHMFGPTSPLGRFVRQLLHPDPNQRPSAQQVLEHDIFKASSTASSSFSLGS